MFQALTRYRNFRSQMVNVYRLWSNKLCNDVPTEVQALSSGVGSYFQVILLGNKSPVLIQGIRQYWQLSLAVARCSESLIQNTFYL